MDFVKKYIIWFVALLIIVLLIIFFKHFFTDKKSSSSTIIIKDTNLITRYDIEVKKDTVIKWYENIVYKKSEPDKIFYQKTDTIFIEKTKELDIMLKVKKTNKKLLITAINQNGKILKEYIFDDVNNDFTAISQKENIFVKSNKFYWKSIYPIFNVQYPIYPKKKTKIYTGLETGISYKENLNLELGVLYSPTEKDLILNSNIKINF